MHALNCRCPRCRREASEATLAEAWHFEQDAFEDERVFDEAQEYELAMELLSVATEDELDQFLGRLVRGAWKGLKKAGSAIGRIARPLGGVLRGVAKAALPMVGGALGSFIPIPGVGTMIGRAVGQAVSSALEAETAAIDAGMRDVEKARRFVRIAGTAARQLARGAESVGDPQTAARDAVLAAARRHLRALARSAVGRPASGRWQRRGDRIVVLGA